MDRSDVDWRGFWPASPTPFTESREIDEVGFRTVLRLYLGMGVHGLVINGTTGEWFSQTEAERRRVAELAVDEVAGEVPVVIGCSSFTPDAVAQLAQHAGDLGADGIMVTPPPYASPTNREIVAFYAAISKKVSSPILVYNWCRGTGVEITASVARELAKIDQVVALKDSTIHKGQFLETLEAVVEDLRVFGGFISRVGLAVLSGIGGDGSIDGGALPGHAGPQFFEAVWRGDMAEARDAATKYTRIMGELINPDWSGVYGSPQAQLKAAMNILGQPGGYPRPPLLAIEDEQTLDELRGALVRGGAMEPAGAFVG
jgi:4-hydroxy-tetrahydrodipicolinate synthase